MENKTKQAHREAVKRYQEKNDRINCIFPANTRERLNALGIEKHSTFIKEVVLNEIEKLEKYKK